MMNSNEVKLELEGSAKRKATDIYDSCIYLSSHGGHATRANSIRTMSQSECMFIVMFRVIWGLL